MLETDVEDQMTFGKCVGDKFGILVTRHVTNINRYGHQHIKLVTNIVMLMADWNVTNIRKNIINIFLSVTSNNSPRKSSN